MNLEKIAFVVLAVITIAGYILIGYDILTLTEINLVSIAYGSALVCLIFACFWLLLSINKLDNESDFNLSSK